MANRMKKDDYVTEETKRLAEEYRQKVKEDREKALARKCVESIPVQRRQYVLDLLSQELATK